MALIEIYHGKPEGLEPPVEVLRRSIDQAETSQTSRDFKVSKNNNAVMHSSDLEKTPQNANAPDGSLLKERSFRRGHSYIAIDIPAKDVSGRENMSDTARNILDSLQKELGRMVSVTKIDDRDIKDRDTGENKVI